MPKVGSKKFSYSAKGKAAAKKFAKKTGQKMISKGSMADSMRKMKRK